MQAFNRKWRQWIPTAILCGALLAAVPLCAQSRTVELSENARAATTNTDALWAAWGVYGDAQPNPIARSNDVRSAPVPVEDEVADPSEKLIDLAMELRGVRYVLGGRTLSSGFDCSGFVGYVFAHAVGVVLPTNSAGQFATGSKIDRKDMRPGDLVFFFPSGKPGQKRVSHVGIYVADGQFIHSPSRGKSVRVDRLDAPYWTRRFAGARRPAVSAGNR